MDTSENLELPYIMPNQAKKHVTHNEAIRQLDAITQISVISKTLLEAPGLPYLGGPAVLLEPAGLFHSVHATSP